MKKTTIARKRASVVLTVVALAAMFALAGCAASGSNDEVLQKLDSMQTQMDEMDARIDQLATDSSNQDAVADDQAAVTEDAKASDSKQGETPKSSSVSDFEAQLASLEKKVDDAVAAADGAAVPENAADRPGAYHDAVAPLEKLDNQLDKFDDALEAAYRNGSMTQEEFWKLEKAESMLETKLEKAEDNLELRMGVDD